MKGNGKEDPPAADGPAASTKTKAANANQNQATQSTDDPKSDSVGAGNIWVVH